MSIECYTKASIRFSCWMGFKCILAKCVARVKIGGGGTSIAISMSYSTGTLTRYNKEAAKLHKSGGIIDMIHCFYSGYSWYVKTGTLISTVWLYSLICGQ
mgnify:CR=1 FL=1